MFSEKVKYIGVDDTDLDLFESQYHVPQGMCYNSYVLMADSITVMDTVDRRKTDEWMAKLDAALNGAKPTYLVVQHVEPDHSGSVGAFLQKYPDTQVVATRPAHKMLQQFGVEVAHEVVIKNGETMDIGGMTLHFLTAPMVHWPEVVMTYVPEELTLFSADAFGKFGVYGADPDNWTDEARRYYFNICGKYGQQVSAALRKVTALSVDAIAPLHGPVLDGDQVYEAVRLYLLWSSYQPETEGVLVAYASIHGHTREAALKFAEVLKEHGAMQVKTIDLTRDDLSEALSQAFRFSRLALCCSSYDGTMFTPMADFLHRLGLKHYQSRRVGLMQNGSWAPMAAKAMKLTLREMKNIVFCNYTVTITGRMQPSNLEDMNDLADALLSNEEVVHLNQRPRTPNNADEDDSEA